MNHQKQPATAANKDAMLSRLAKSLGRREATPHDHTHHMPTLVGVAGQAAIYPHHKFRHEFCGNTDRVELVEGLGRDIQAEQRTRGGVEPSEIQPVTGRRLQATSGQW